MPSFDPNDARPKVAGVIGDPIRQSKSPTLFQHWFSKHDVPGHYVPLHVRADNFEQVLSALPKAGFRGVNVTVPHKLKALACADLCSDAATAIGAANTLTFMRDGRIHADNTDGYGFLQNLQSTATGWAPDAGPVAVLGSGGAARAAIYILLQAQVPEIRLSNRTRDKAEVIADHFGRKITVVDWDERSAMLTGCATIVNTTSLGMVGAGPLEISLDDADQAALVTDMVYNPLKTDLLLQAERRGMRVVDGLGMLLHQARPGFGRWFGPDPEVTEDLRRACLLAEQPLGQT
ncbi:MAG: shikimate dehydrogenase [Pseudomonadota bacterium]